MLSKFFEDSDHKLKTIGILFVLFTGLFIYLVQPAKAASLGNINLSQASEIGQAFVQKVHGFHCNRSGGHAHRAHCPRSRFCMRKCLPFAKYRFNCRNLLKFCLQGKGKSRFKCRIQHRKCLLRARNFCRRACRR